MGTSKRLLAGVLACLVSTASTATNYQTVEAQIKRSEAEMAARIGVSILDTEKDQIWNYRGEERFPLTSTFKTILCAKLLRDADDEKLSLDKTVKVEKSKLVTYSPVMEKRIDQQVSLGDACSATMLTSDNTAANIVLESVGGPQDLTQFIRGYGDQATRIDRYETELNEGTPKDVRDTTTPEAMVKSLNVLLFGNVLSLEAREQLTLWLRENKVTGNLLRSVLPHGWNIGDRSGAGGNGSRSITAVVWPADSYPVIISIYVTETTASFEERNAAVVKIGQSIFEAMQALAVNQISASKPGDPGNSIK